MISHDPYMTTSRSLTILVYHLANVVSPLYVYCRQQQNMLEGKIALSISPFLVVDDNTHIALKIICAFQIWRAVIICLKAPPQHVHSDLGIKQGTCEGISFNA